MPDIEAQIEELTRQLAELGPRQLQMDKKMGLIENQLETNW